MFGMSRQEGLGILGGVGPLASAEFLKTIYEHCRAAREQDMPRVLMYSDPSFPDRTEALLAGDFGPLLEQLTRALNDLRRMGASKVVVCCITMHYLFPMLPAEARNSILSLLDIIFECVIEARKKSVLFCSSGSAKMHLFHEHPRWERAKEFIILPDQQHQNQIHNLIYEIKLNRDVRELAPAFESLIREHGTDSFIAGCTELHLVSKHLDNGERTRGGFECIDPLTEIAKQLAGGGIWGVATSSICSA